MHSLLIDIRDYSYHSDISEPGDKEGFYGYRFKVELFLFFYYLDLWVFLIYSTRPYIDFLILRIYSSGGEAFVNPITVLIALFLFYIPYYLIINYTLKSISHVPIRINLSDNAYSKVRNKSFAVLFLGMASTWLCVYLFDLIYD